MKHLYILFLTLGILRVLADAQVLQNVNGTTVAGATAGQSVTNNGTLTANVVIGDGARGVVNGSASGAVPANADGSATTAAQVNTLFPGFIGTNNNANAFVIFTNNQVSLSVNSSGIFTLTNYAAAGLGLIWSTNGGSTTTGPATFSGGTIAAASPEVSVSQTWNNSGVAFTAFLVNATNTASSANSALLVLQTGGTTQFWVRKDGVLTAPTLNDSAPNYFIGSSGVNVANNKLIGFSSSSTASSSFDTYLERSAAGTVLVDTNIIAKGTITATNGFASYATDATVALTATGITNALGKDGTAYVTATAIAFTIKDRSQATLYTSPTLTATIPVHLQNGWSVNAASGLAGTLIAD